jgi:hypothetical protein
MGLNLDDPMPEGITFRDAYTAILGWYQANVGRYAADERAGDHAAAAKQYVDALPPAASASEDEMRDCFRRVIAGDLEWGYHCSDGRYKMAAYAEAAFDAAGEKPFPSQS